MHLVMLWMMKKKMSDDTIPHSDDPFWKWEPLDTVGLNDDIKSLDDLGITPRDVSDEYDDDSDEYRSDQVYDSLDNIYHFDQKKDLPKSNNILDYFTPSNLKLGRKYREGMFYHLRDSEQKMYGKKRNLFAQEMKKRGFDLFDSRVQDAIDYQAGQSVLNWINSLDENSTVRKYYYGHHKMSEFLMKDPTFSFDSLLDPGEFFDDFEGTVDDAIDFFSIFDDIFGT